MYNVIVPAITTVYLAVNQNIQEMLMICSNKVLLFKKISVLEKDRKIYENKLSRQKLSI